MKNFKPRLAIDGVFAGFINEETNLLDDRGVDVYYGDRVMYIILLLKLLMYYV